MADYLKNNETLTQAMMYSCPISVSLLIDKPIVGRNITNRAIQNVSGSTVNFSSSNQIIIQN